MNRKCGRVSLLSQRSSILAFACSRVPPLPTPFPPLIMVSFAALTTADGLAALDKHLASRSYVEG